MSNTEQVQDRLDSHDISRGDLVVIGSSAGGIEALSIFVSTLPTSFPAPIVLAQHLDPSRISNLDTILRHRSTLPVELVESRCQLQGGKIYVVPANRHVTISAGHVEVQGNRNQRPRPSVDLLLSTAAKVYGDRLIAVILTGSGSDGSAGAIDVKAAGGVVIVQDPKTARFPSMPLALSPSIVDFEVDLERLGQLLFDLLTGVDNFPRLEEKTEEVLRAILALVSRQAHIDFRLYKTSTIMRRISRRMIVTYQKTIRDYLEYLGLHAEEVGELVKAFLINVTQFFRDAAAFAYLKSEILPKLIAQARDRDQVIRMWIAGCASGEEPYSLAMILTDLLGEELTAWNVKIFATDVDEATITFARRGLYTENMLKDVPVEYRERFFERVDHGYRTSKALRQMVIFGQQDLARSAPFPRIDLVACRNVLIYFSPELQDYVLNQFAFSLAHGGYLFLGKAETIRPTQTYYELVNKQWKIYHCISGTLPLALRYSTGSSNATRSPTLSRRSEPVNNGIVQEQSSPVLELGQIHRLNELLLRFLPMGVVVIDRNYHVVTANGTARRLLGLRDIANDQDFLHAVRGIPYMIVRNAIDAVFRERSTMNLPEIELEVSSGGNGRFVSLSLVLMQMEASMPDLVIMSTFDVTEQIQTRHQLEVAQAEQTQLMEELSSANKRLNNVNKELLDANEELQVANEELMLTHEELQATVEEFETTNEELQATNEELETNNEELQATNEELETTNEELRARTNELQELMLLLESERVRFAEMVELSPFYILVLRGPQLAIEAYNPRYARLLEERKVLGQPLVDVYELFWEAGIEGVRLALEVYRQDSIRTTSRIRTYMPNSEGETVERYLVYTIVPSHDAVGHVTGVIIYAVDETVQREKAAEEERERLKLIFDNSAEVALGLFDAYTTELLLGSPRYLSMFAHMLHCETDALIGKKWGELNPASQQEQRDEIWATTLEQRNVYHLPEVHYKLLPEGSETDWAWSLTPILDTKNTETVQYMLVSLVEITEHVQARQEMEQLNRLKDDFLSLAGHELRTPLTAIMGYAELMDRSFKEQMEQMEMNGDAASHTTLIRNVGQEHNSLERIIHQVQSMEQLINELVDLTRMRDELFQLNLRENVNIVALVLQIVEHYSFTSRREIILEATEETIQLTTDEARLEQVLNNLVSNAIKYSPSEKPVVVGIERNAQQVMVWVRDEGNGLSAEEQAHIFERFYRVNSASNVKVDGLGLGLYIASEIVSRLGGRLWVESQVEHGSTFFVSLPLEQHAAKGE